MTERSQTVLTQVLSFSLEERATLAVEIIASIDGEPEADAEAAWATEIENRARRVISGQSKGQPWEEALNDIERQRIKK